MKYTITFILCLFCLCASASVHDYDALIRKYDVAQYLREAEDSSATSFWAAVLSNNPRLIKLFTPSLRNKKSFERACLQLVYSKKSVDQILDKLFYVTDMPFLDSLSANLLNDSGVIPFNESLNIEYYYDSYPNAFADPFSNIRISSSLYLLFSDDYLGLLGIVIHECAHSLLMHTLQNEYATEEKYRKNRIASGIFSGLSIVTAGIASATGSDVNWNAVGRNVSTAYDLAYTDAYGRFSFKYSREEEVEADIIAFRFLEWIGVDGRIYVEALRKLDSSERISNRYIDGDHPTTAFRIGVLERLIDLEYISMK